MLNIFNPEIMKMAFYLVQFLSFLFPCIVVLGTKIVVEFMFLYNGLQR